MDQRDTVRLGKRLDDTERDVKPPMEQVKLDLPTLVTEESAKLVMRAMQQVKSALDCVSVSRSMVDRGSDANAKLMVEMAADEFEEAGKWLVEHAQAIREAMKVLG